MVGSTVDLSWSSANASSCNASGAWSGSKAVSGTETVTIETAGNLTFSLTCIGEGGNASRSVTIEGYRNITGISVDGYISGASIIVDTNENYMMDAGESETSSSSDWNIYYQIRKRCFALTRRSRYRHTDST